MTIVSGREYIAGKAALSFQNVIFQTIRRKEMCMEGELFAEALLPLNLRIVSFPITPLRLVEVYVSALRVTAPSRVSE
jgi:hypothetical protein